MLLPAELGQRKIPGVGGWAQLERSPRLQAFEDQATSEKQRVAEVRTTLPVESLYVAPRDNAQDPLSRDDEQAFLVRATNATSPLHGPPQRHADAGTRRGGPTFI